MQCVNFHLKFIVVGKQKQEPKKVTAPKKKKKNKKTKAGKQKKEANESGKPEEECPE